MTDPELSIGQYFYVKSDEVFDPSYLNDMRPGAIVKLNPASTQVSFVPNHNPIFDRFAGMISEDV